MKNSKFLSGDVFVLVLFVLLTLHQYGRLLGGIPVEQEANFFQDLMSRTPWSQVWLLQQYNSLYPLANALIKALSYLREIGGSVIVVHLFTLFVHVANVFFFYLWLKRRWWTDQQGVLGGPNVWWPALASLLFCSFNAYYLLLLSSHNGPLHVVHLATLLVVVLLLDRAEVARWQWISALVLVFFMPALYFYPLPVLLFLGLLWRERRSREVLSTAISYFLSFAMAALFLDGRTAIFELVKSSLPGGISAIFVQNPLLFFAAVLQNLWSAAAFGLLFQNFLWGLSPFGAGYMVGMLLSVVLIVSHFWQPKDRLLFFGWGLIFAALFNVVLLRNIFTVEEPGRIYDGAYVASMPRYFYLPSLGLALVVAVLFKSLFQKARSLRGAIVFLAILFVFTNSIATREKVLFVANRYAPDVWDFTPLSILRPPQGHPENPAFRINAPFVPKNE